VPDAVGLDVFGDGVEPGLADAEGPRLVVLGVGLDQVALAGGGVLLGDLHDDLLHCEGATEKSMCRGIRACLRRIGVSA
jgi:hypothetical protein